MYKTLNQKAKYISKAPILVTLLLSIVSSGCQSTAANRLAPETTPQYQAPATSSDANLTIVPASPAHYVNGKVDTNGFVLLHAYFGQYNKTQLLSLQGEKCNTPAVMQSKHQPIAADKLQSFELLIYEHTGKSQKLISCKNRFSFIPEKQASYQVQFSVHSKLHDGFCELKIVDTKKPNTPINFIDNNKRQDSCGLTNSEAASRVANGVNKVKAPFKCSMKRGARDEQGLSNLGCQYYN